MTVPAATYRLQLRNGLTFSDAARLAPYFADLGISHIYLSPIFRAAPRSTHGYDAVDFNEIDPVLGGLDGFNELFYALNRFGLKIIIDFVPNHMVACPDNAWWHDVLEWGHQSRYRGHFDIDWSAPKLLCPILGKQYGSCLAEREITIAFDAKNGIFLARYFDNWVPLSPSTYGHVLDLTEGTEFLDIGKSFAECEPRASHELKTRLSAFLPEKKGLVTKALLRLNDDIGVLHTILEAQPWRLAYWRTAREMLTYRRFFEISDLVGLRVEEQSVFDDVHRTVLSLIKAGKIDGLRIDHIDGLADPKGYLERLRRATADVPQLYLVAEKILGTEEEVRANWPIDGTTGYEFIQEAANVFCSGNLDGLDRSYADFTGAAHDYSCECYHVKRRTLTFNLASELRVLVSMATEVAQADVATRDFGRDTLRDAIVEIASHFKVYRTYIEKKGPSTEDESILHDVGRRAKANRKIEDLSAVDFIVALLTVRVPTALRNQAVAFAVRFQQTTGPLMAKAVEDTEFYRFNRLIALNEVGGEPALLRPGSNYFHAAMSRRQLRMARGLTATTTHDTKRGEDARARLYALSSMQEEWADAVKRWSNMLRSVELGGIGREAEWLFYQALAGAWPMDDRPADDFKERMVQFMAKAAREAKLLTSWTDPNTEYEERISRFVRGALDPNSAFLADFRQTVRPLVNAGAAASLVQTVLKIFAPGLPDIYQGSELWDLSLVDPDNRRPVDFERRESLVAQFPEGVPSDEHAWRSAGVKFELLRRSLRLRRQMDFTEASYEPLPVDGDAAKQSCAFMRRGKKSTAIVVSAIVSAQDYRKRSFGFDGTSWRGTRISLPSHLGKRRFTNIFTGAIVALDDHMIEVAAALQYLPVAVLHAE